MAKNEIFSDKEQEGLCTKLTHAIFSHQPIQSPVTATTTKTVHFPQYVTLI